MYKNLDVVFLGGMFPHETEAEIIKYSIGSIQNAANNLQWEIVNGLDSNLDKPVKIFNSLYIGSFPKRYKKIIIDTYEFSHTDCYSENSRDINVGFVNFSGFKNFSRYFSLKPYVKEWALAKNNKKKIIIAYAMTSTFTSLLQYVKKLNSDVITCLVVPDLPKYMNLLNSKDKIYTSLKSIEMKIINLNMKYIDRYVLLTKYMEQALNIKTTSVVVEGISTNLFEHINPIPQNEGIKTILYSGGLNEKYGVVNLVHSFEKLEQDNLRLVICGSGEAEEIIRKACLRDKRIIFRGLLKREEVLQLQKSSTLLVNPRPNNDEYTRYSFPSKIMEYMSSGTPVIAYKLDGIPDEYDKYIHYFIGSEPGDIASKINEVLEKTEEERQAFGESARKFVINNKNNVAQAHKILKMLVE